MTKKDCTFQDASKIILSVENIDYDGKELAEGISIPEIEAIIAEPTLSGTSYSASNMEDYPLTITAVKGSGLHDVLEKAFLNRECLNMGLFDYNANGQLALVTSSSVVLSRGDMKVGDSSGRVYKVHATWTTL